MAAELIAQLHGGAAEREAAYVELLRRETQHNASSSPGASSAPAAVRDEELRGMKLSALRARAMEEELDEAAVESALDADEPKAALVELLLARRPSAEEKLMADIAVACASPLCEVLCKPVSEVSVAEYHRACQVLTALSGVDPVRVGGEACKLDQCTNFNVWKAPDSALGVMLGKEPSALTPEDALTAAFAFAPQIVQMATCNSVDAAVQVAGITALEWVSKWIDTEFMNLVTTPTDDRNLVLVPLLLELLKAPEKLPDFVLREILSPASSWRCCCGNTHPTKRLSVRSAGVLFTIAQGTIGRHAVAARLLEQDAITVLVDTLCQTPPVEWITVAGFARRPHGEALHAVALLVETAQAGGIDLTAQLLSCGFIDMVVSSLTAAETMAADHTNGFILLAGPLWILKTLTGEALDQVEDKVRAIPSALRYVKDSQLGHCTHFGTTCGVYGTIVAANLYGKDEDNTFGFARE